MTSCGGATIAFDLDGTLIDSVAHIHASVAAALDDLSLPSVTRDETRGFVGQGLPPLLDKVLARIDRPATLRDRLHDRVMAHYTTTPHDPATVYPGVPRALSALRAAGHRLTICTNKPFDACQSALRDTALAEFFDLVLAGDSLATRKPDPQMLFAALDGAATALFVGDSETDCDTARAARVPFVLFTEGYRQTPPEHLPHAALFSDWSAVPDIVGRLLTQVQAGAGHGITPPPPGDT